jgi:GAF domain-containing protein
LAAPIPFDEDARQKRLEGLALLGTNANPRIDALTARALTVFPGVSIAAVSLIDRDRLWFKSAIGMPVTESPRSISFCSHTILQARTLVVPNTALDRRFADSPLVAGEASFRFYVGERLLDGLGALCVIGTKPRPASQSEVDTLVKLARLVEAQLLMESALTLLARHRVH